MSRSTIVYLGLGSNLDNPPFQLEKAVDSLSKTPSFSELKVSSTIQSPPLGGPEQPDYYNQVCRLKTKDNARAVFNHIRKIEDQQGRTRDVHWGPRTIDIDILIYGNHIVCERDLVIPHSDMHRRVFVLKPLVELDENLIDPITKFPFTQLYKQLISK
jgi:2-amino-4-hydroxy-6-hydroxymethyldihydropteridine diphosphokinase